MKIWIQRILWMEYLYPLHVLKFQKTKYKPMFPSEVVNNSEDRVLTNYHDKAVKNYEDGALNNQEVFDNGKSTEFQSKEVNLGNVVTEVSFAPNGDIPTKSNGMFAPNGDIPAKSDGMFAPNGDIPAKSDGMFAPNRDIPAKSDQMFGDIPAKSIGMIELHYFNGDMVSDN